MNLSTVKSIAVPEGNVMALSIGGVKVWSAGSGGGEPAELYSWEGVAYHIDKGTYKDVYAIGDMVPLDLGSEGLINMQIAAFDKDILADGSGTAAISWVAKELLATKHRMNPKIASNGDGTYQEGTGAIYGWEKCEMRTYLKETIKPLIPKKVADMIQVVTKTTPAYIDATQKITQAVEDDVWLPDKSEVVTAGGIYTGLFNTNSSRKKQVVGTTSSTYWWLRTGASHSSFGYVTTSGGGTSSADANGEYGVCLGFCTGKTPT